MTEIMFIGIFVFAIVATVTVNLLSRKLHKQTGTQFDKTEYLLFEEKISEYLSSHRADAKNSIADIINCIGYTVDLNANLPDGIEGRRSQDGMNIEIQNGLQLEDRMFTLAHEIAHDINGDTVAASRNSHSILFKKRDRNEQICDYYAAALLLPLQEMTSVVARYEKLTKGKRLQMIRELAEEKNVREEVVFRRIQEVRIILSE